MSVFRTTIRADETTDVETAIGDLRVHCEKAGISAPNIGLLLGQTREILGALVSRGKQLSAQGSQLSVTRELSGEGYDIRLVFGAGLPRMSIWKRLLRALRVN
jgi:hypothetical protein